MSRRNELLTRIPAGAPLPIGAALILTGRYAAWMVDGQPVVFRIDPPGPDEKRTLPYGRAVRLCLGDQVLECEEIHKGTRARIRKGLVSLMDLEL